MNLPGRPPIPESILASPHAWVRLGREDAVRLCRMAPVVVVYSNLGQVHSAWFDSASPFYYSDRPYDYAGLRYFAPLRKGAAGRGGTLPPKPALAAPPKAGPLEPPSPDQAGLPGRPGTAGTGVPGGSKRPDLPAAPGGDKTKHPVDIRLLDAQGRALAGASFSLTLPGGSVIRGRSDGEGFIRVPDNPDAGEVLLAVEKAV